MGEQEKEGEREGRKRVSEGGSRGRGKKRVSKGGSKKAKEG